MINLSLYITCVQLHVFSGEKVRMVVAKLQRGTKAELFWISKKQLYSKNYEVGHPCKSATLYRNGQIPMTLYMVITP